MATPKATALRPTVRTVTCVRRATARAPTREPRLSTEKSTVNEERSPPSSRATNSGTTVEKLNASVPMTAIITSGTHRAGTLWA